MRPPQRPRRRTDPEQNKPEASAHPEAAEPSRPVNRRTTVPTGDRQKPETPRSSSPQSPPASRAKTAGPKLADLRAKLAAGPGPVGGKRRNLPSRDPARKTQKATTPSSRNAGEQPHENRAKETADSPKPAGKKRKLGSLRRQPADRETIAISTVLSERLQERRQAKRKLWRLRAISVLAALSLLAIVGWVIWFSPLLALDSNKIKVKGASAKLPTVAVTAAVQPWYGVPLPRLNVDRVAAAVGEVPMVGTAVVERSWPTGLTITVQERRPVVVGRSGKDFVLLDRDAVNLGKVAQAPAGMPVVTVPLAAKGEAKEALAAVLTVSAELPDNLRAGIREAGAANPKAVVLTLKNGAQVRWGGTDNSQFKAKVLETLLKQPARVYDVSDPAHPVTS